VRDVAAVMVLCSPFVLCYLCRMMCCLMPFSSSRKLSSIDGWYTFHGNRCYALLMVNAYYLALSKCDVDLDRPLTLLRLPGWRPGEGTPGGGGSEAGCHAGESESSLIHYTVEADEEKVQLLACCPVVGQYKECLHDVHAINPPRSFQSPPTWQLSKRAGHPCLAPPIY
jgi:hypothetical protein